jgi:type II secretory pathway pseudopilin PulG
MVMRQRGYNMVMLMIAITVLNIMVAIALPSWTSLIQRDKEEELISRGFQYVEAIRVFQNRFQRLPVRIEELIEVKPRCIRRLWKDPMTDGGKFAVIHPDQPQPNGALQPRVPGQGNDPGDGTGNNPEGGDDSQPGPDPGSLGGVPKGEISVGPIIGVRSRSNKKSFLVFTGKEHYDEWRFTLDMMLGGRQAPPPPNGQPPPGTPAPGAGMQLSTRWLGRPLPSFLQPQGGGLPGGESNGEEDQQPQPPGGKGPAGRLPRSGGKL